MDVITNLSVDNLALATAALLGWVALVHLTLAAGVRRGELLWSGRHPRLLAPELRLRSAVSAVLLVGSGWVLAEAAGLLSFDLIPAQYMQSATFAVASFLGIYFIYLVIKGSRWERMFFAPITLAGALLAVWMTIP